MPATVRFEGNDPFGLRGKELLAWRRRVQMVFQDPFASLNARMTAGDIIAEPWATHRGLYPTPQEREARVRELLDLVGLRASDARQVPAGVLRRPAPAHRHRPGPGAEPGVSSCDEPVSALDLSVQAQVLNLLNELQQELGVSYIFISHDLSVVRHVADRVAVMYLGRIIETGATEDVFDRPRHPYTAALMSASPKLDRPTGPRNGLCCRANCPRRWTRRRAADSARGAGRRRTSVRGRHRLPRRQNTSAGCSLASRSCAGQQHRPTPPNATSR